ncbi:MAG: periplasmic heavy metal sensor [Hyalangium sp.]|uniref:periplasmic heavy metal sensor n=1 Tax=Hyalangium sp. TaxID=2028555 RepID=UPI00389AA2EA
MTLKPLSFLALAVVLCAIPAAAQSQDGEGAVDWGGASARPPPPMPPPPPGPHMMGPPMFAHGIPPQVVDKLGLSKDVVQRIQELTFEADGQLITLEADLKRAHLELDKLLHSSNPNENAVMQQVEAVGRAETAVHKNRVGLMLQIQRILGPDAWQKLQAEMGDMRREFHRPPPRPGPQEDGARPPEPRK